MLSQNVIKPIQPTKTPAQNSPSLPSLSHTHSHTQTHTHSTGPHILSDSKPREKATDFHSFLGASSPAQITGHDVLAMHVLGPRCTAQSPSTALCCGISGRPFYKHLPREPVSEVPIQRSQKLQLPMTLSFHWLGLTNGEPRGDPFGTTQGFLDHFVMNEA